jgi:hypothetical protein
MAGCPPSGTAPPHRASPCHLPRPCRPRSKQARKLGCCAFSLGNCLALNILTVGFFTLCCLYPRAIGATFKGTCPMPALLAFVLGMAVAVGLYSELGGCADQENKSQRSTLPRPVCVGSFFLM